MLFPLFNAALLDATNRVYNGKSQNASFICSPTVDNHSLTLAQYISKCLPAMESMACTNGKSVHVRIVRIRCVFPKVCPRMGARYKSFGKTMKCVHPYINRYITLFCTHVPIIRNMLQCTHCARYPQTCSASHARLALHHVGAFDVRLSAMLPERVTGHPGAAVRYRWSWPAWLVASCRRSRSRISVGLHCSAMIGAATWSHGAMPMPGQHVGAYPHG